MTKCKIHPKHRVPVRAIFLCVFIVCLLSLLNIGSASYIAFGAITSLTSLALYASYFIAISSMIYARYFRKGGVRLGEWNWGKWGGPMNIFAWFYTLYIAIWLPFPSTLPVTASNMNYCGPIMVAVLVIAVTAWFGWARKHWSGPNVTIMDFIVATSRRGPGLQVFMNNAVITLLLQPQLTSCNTLSSASTACRLRMRQTTSSRLSALPLPYFTM